MRGEREGPRPICGRPSNTTEPLKITNSFDPLNPEVLCTSIHNVRMSDQAESIDLPCTLESKKQLIPSVVTIDCGANGSLIDPQFVQRNKLPTAKRKFPARAILADGKQVQQIDQTVTTGMTIGPHQEKITLDVMKLGGTPILLGNGWLRKHGVKIDFEKPQFKFQSSYCQNNCNVPQSFTIVPKCPQNIRKPDAPDTYLEEIKKVQQKQEQRIYQVSVHQDVLRNQVPKEYHEYLNVFSKELADQLPPRRYIDHEISLEFRKRPYFGPLYNLSQKELETQKKYIEEQVIKGFMRPSQSSAASPMILSRTTKGLLESTQQRKEPRTMTIGTKVAADTLNPHYGGMSTDPVTPHPPHHRETPRRV